MISLKKADGDAVKSPVSTRLRYSMDHYLNSARSAHGEAELTRRPTVAVAPTN